MVEHSSKIFASGGKLISPHHYHHITTSIRDWVRTGGGGGGRRNFPQGIHEALKDTKYRRDCLGHWPRKTARQGPHVCVETAIRSETQPGHAYLHTGKILLSLLANMAACRPLQSGEVGNCCSNLQPAESKGRKFKSVINSIILNVSFLI